MFLGYLIDALPGLFRSRFFCVLHPGMASEKCNIFSRWEAGQLFPGIYASPVDCFAVEDQIAEFARVADVGKRLSILVVRHHAHTSNFGKNILNNLDTMDWQVAGNDWRFFIFACSRSPFQDGVYLRA